MSKILIIDDESHIRGLLKKLLLGKGHTVLEASDGASGIWLYRENLPDIVITDINMSIKGGLELISELFQDFPDVNIIVMSGTGCTSEDSILNIAKELGAKYTLNKPFRNQEVLDAIEFVEKMNL